MHIPTIRSFAADKAAVLRARPIALFAPSLSGGGAERVLLNLARGLRELGHEIDIVLVRAKGELLPQVPTNVSVIDLGAKRTITSLFSLARYLRRRRPAGLIAFLDHANVVAFWASILARERTPVVATIHGTWSRILREGNYKTRILASVASHAYKRMDRVVAVSEAAAVDLANSFGLLRSTVRIIYNPVIVPELWHRAKESIDHPWFEKGQPPVIIAVGRLTKEKDFPTLIRAFSDVRTTRACRLLILGEGRERSALEELIRNLNLEGEVLMPGFVHNPYKYMHCSSLFVLSSSSEALPTVLIEALALGIPIISTDCESGPREILKNGTLGSLTKVGDVASMSARIHQSLSTSPRCLSKHNISEYDFLAAARKYELLLTNQFLNHGSPAELLDFVADV